LKKLSLKGTEKVLVIQLRRIGDALMCTPAIRALRKSFPEMKLFFFTEHESASLFSENPFLDGVITLDQGRSPDWVYQLKKVLEIRGHQFNLVIDFLSNPRSGWYSFTSGAKYRIGMGQHGRSLFYNLRFEHSSKRAYAASKRVEFLKSLGVEPDGVTLDLFLDRQSEEYADRSLKGMGLAKEDFLISVSPTSRRHFNRWPLERYAAVIQRLRQRYAPKFIITWGPGEREVAERLQRMSGEEAVLVSPPTKNLLELGAILSHCHLHLGNDNGTKHIAVAVGLPTVTIYGPHDPVSWTFPDPKRHLYLQGLPLCEDCKKRKHSCQELSCLDRIAVHEVLATCQDLIERLPELRKFAVSGVKVNEPDAPGGFGSPNAFP
jgi:heptosyltransferase-3